MSNLPNNDEPRIFIGVDFAKEYDRSVYFRRDHNGVTQVSAASVAAQSQYRWPGRDSRRNKVGEVGQELHPFARQLCGSESRDRGNVQRQFEQSAEGRIRTVIDLRRVLLALGLLLTMIAVGLATAMTINRHGPSLVELSLLAIAVLMAAEQSQ
jgi:membrane glycosyltransferase